MTSETWVLSKIENKNTSALLLLEEKYQYIARGILLNLIALVFRTRLKQLDPREYAKFAKALSKDLAVVEDIVGAVGLGLINECIAEWRDYSHRQSIKGRIGGLAYVKKHKADVPKAEEGIIIHSDGTWAFDLISERFKQETKEFVDKQGDLPALLQRLYDHFNAGKGSPYRYLQSILIKEIQNIGQYGRPKKVSHIAESDRIRSERIAKEKKLNNKEQSNGQTIEENDNIL